MICDICVICEKYLCSPNTLIRLKVFLKLLPWPSVISVRNFFTHRLLRLPGAVFSIHLRRLLTKRATETFVLLLNKQYLFPWIFQNSVNSPLHFPTSPKTSNGKTISGFLSVEKCL